jgi:hypothetical protein
MSYFLAPLRSSQGSPAYLMALPLHAFNPEVRQLSRRAVAVILPSKLSRQADVT